MNDKQAKRLRRALRARLFAQHGLTERDRMYRIGEGTTQANHFLGHDAAGRRVMGPRPFIHVRLAPGSPRDVYQRTKRTIVVKGGMLRA